jgi:hypothetical protein
MAWVLHWKISAAMAASYAAAAALFLYFIRSTTTIVAVLIILFALVLLAGNMYVRAMEKAQGARRRAHGEPDDGNGGQSLRPAPRALRLDPEAGRR